MFSSCRILPLVLLLAALPMAGAAQSPRTFSLPANCTAYLTVQSKSCTVSHHFTCTGDPEGWQRRVDLDEAGVVYFGTIDAETQWLESVHFLAGHTERLADSPADPASFSELISTGHDSYDFQTNSDEIGTTRFVGEDRLTGETVTIDGVTLDRTEYHITASDSGGSVLWESRGNEYISRDWRLFLSGQSHITTPDESWDSDEAPVEFILPGEPGFLTTSPKYGCNEVMSSATIPGGILPAAFTGAE